jgi:hypothetical protein
VRHDGGAVDAELARKLPDRRTRVSASDKFADHVWLQSVLKLLRCAM